MNALLWIKYYTNSQQSNFKIVIIYVEIIFSCVFFFDKSNFQ